MGFSLEFILLMLFILTIAIIGMVLLIIYNKKANDFEQKLKIDMLKYISKGFGDVNLSQKLKGQHKILKHEHIFLDQYLEFCQISQNKEITYKANAFLVLRKIDQKYIQQLKSRSKFKRIQAAIYLGYIDSLKVIEALNFALQIEKVILVKLYIIESLSRFTSPSSIPIIINTLYYTPKWYREKVYVLLSCFGRDLFTYLSTIIDDERDEVQRLIVHFAENYPAENLKNYLLTKAKYANKIKIQTLNGLQNIDKITHNQYFESEKQIDKLGGEYYESLRSVFNRENFIQIIDKLTNSVCNEPIPEDLFDYEPPKKYHFIYHKFKWLTYNDTKFESFLTLFTEEFETKNQKEITLKINELVNRWFQFHKLAIQDTENDRLAELELLKNSHSELYDSTFWETVEIPENTSLESELQLSNPVDELRREYLKSLKEIFNKDNFVLILKLLNINSETDSIPENLINFKPPKELRFIYHKFKWLTYNTTKFENIWILFTEEFESRNQKETTRKIDELVTKVFVFQRSIRQKEEISHLAAKALLKNFHSELYDEHFLSHPDFEIRKIAIEALSKQYTKANINKSLRAESS